MKLLAKYVFAYLARSWGIIRQVPQCRESELECDIDHGLLSPVPDNGEQLLHVVRLRSQLTRLLSCDLSRCN